MSYGQVTPDLSADPSIIPLPDPTTLAGQVQLPPPPPPLARRTAPPDPNVVLPPPPAVTDLGHRTAPSVIPHALPMSRFALTQTPTTAPAPGINPTAPTTPPGYFESSTDPNTGQPTALNPSLTKLGKLLTVLRAAGQGAAVGSTQPTFGGGFMAAQQNQNEQTNQFQRQQQAGIGLQQSRASMGLVDTPWGTMPRGTYNSLLGKVLPAQIAGETRENVADTAAGSRQNVAQTAALSREKVAGIMAQSKADVAGAAGTIITPELAKQYNLAPNFIGTRAKITDLAAAQRAGVFENIPMMTDKGLVVVNRSTGKVRQATGDDEQKYAQAAMAMPQEVADPNNPGQTTFVPKGQLAAGGYQGTGSAALQVPRAAAKAEVPTKIGDQKVAFTTMIQHADLLRRAAKALNNGDMQTLNGLENAFKNEFGYSGPITSAAIADAYKGEVANVINKGHITDTGNEKIAHTLDPTRQNYETLDGVLGAYQNLAQSKMDKLNLQEQAAIDRAQAKKTKPGNAPPGGGDNAPPKHPVGLVPF